MTDIRPSLDEFPAWAQSTLGMDVTDPKWRRWVQSGIQDAYTHVAQHQIFGKIEKFLTNNQSTHGSSLNIEVDKITLNRKPVDSIISKLYRINISKNKEFPSPPKTGWVDSKNLFSSINDMVRTTIICRYIHEPRKIADHLMELGAQCGLHSRSDAQAMDHGYYAYHVYYRIPAKIAGTDWVEIDEDIEFEVQITTQMQHMLYDLTHTFYEKERNLSEKDESWKWDYQSAKFSARYLSHTMHLIEGMIAKLYEDSAEKEIGGTEKDIAPSDTDALNAVDQQGSRQ